MILSKKSIPIIQTKFSFIKVVLTPVDIQSFLWKNKQQTTMKMIIILHVNDTVKPKILKLSYFPTT